MQVNHVIVLTGKPPEAFNDKEAATNRFNDICTKFKLAVIRQSKYHIHASQDNYLVSLYFNVTIQ